MTLYSIPFVYLSKLCQIHAVLVDFLGEKKYSSGSSQKNTRVVKYINILYNYICCLLRYNLYTVKFTLSCITFDKCIQAYIHQRNQDIEDFQHPSNYLRPLVASTFLYSQPLASSDLFSVRTVCFAEQIFLIWIKSNL